MAEEQNLSYQLVASEQKTKTIAMNVETIEKLHITHSPFIYVQAGQQRLKAKLIAKDMGEKAAHLLYLSSSLLESLFLYSGIKLKVSYQKETNTLRLGPILGLFTVLNASSTERMIPIFQEFILAGRQKSVLTYVFSPQKIDIDQKKYLLGYVYNWKLHRWVKRQFPIPDVVYDRVGSRMLENCATVQQTKENLKSIPTISYFNDRYLDKWEVYNELYQDELLQNYIPYTLLLLNFSDVISMLKKYRQVYVKPIQGSHGLGICWIKRTKKGYHGHFINWQGQEKIWKASTEKQLSQIIKRIVGSSRYIVQQGLNISSKGNSPCDIRMLMQKDALGEWRLTTSIGRMALDGSKISNYEHGGTLISVYRLLKASGIKGKISYKQKKIWLITFGKYVCEKLEEGLGLQFAELGLDVAIDNNNHLWLLEVNAKPGRDIKETSNNQPPLKARLSVRRVVDYATFLAGFAEQGGKQ